MRRFVSLAVVAAWVVMVAALVRKQTAPAAPAEDPMAKLTKLAELHTAGVLTDEEFAAAKAQLLGI